MSFLGREVRMFFHKPQIGYLLLLCCLHLMITHQHIKAETLTIATSQYTGDWNPIRYQTYPAMFVVRVTTERLFEQKCSGNETRSNLFENICQASEYDLNRNVLRFQFNDVNCPNCANDYLSIQDIQFTIDQIKKVETNFYHYNDFSIKSPPYLVIGKPQNVASYFFKQYLDFPILRENNIKLNTVFFTGSEKNYNNITAGHYQIDSIGDHQIVLKQRKCSRSNKLSVSEIKITFYDTISGLSDEVEDKERQPHIVMAMPINFKKHKKDYIFRETQDLNSFTYIGFNYICKDRAKQKLFFDERFRKLFTQSIWKLTPIINKMNIDGENPESDGIFLGESFERKRSTPFISEDRLKEQIRRYLSDSHTKNLTINIIMSPFTEYQFDSDVNTMQQQLNNVWAPGITFHFKPPVKGKGGYSTLIDNNNFDMNFGQFYYGRSHLRFMAFMKQDSPLNILKVPNTLMPIARIEKCMNNIHGNGETDFYKLLNEKFPVAVIGSFKRRDLFSKRIEKVNVCRENTIQEPYFGIHKWRLKQ